MNSLSVGVRSISVGTAHGAVDTLGHGHGPPLIVLHDDVGRERWTPFHERLAERHEVFAPSMPGYGATPLCEWMRNPRQLAAVLAEFVRAVAHDHATSPGPVTLVGCGFGGWVAVELSLYACDVIEAVALVAPVGLKPTDGVVTDQFLIGSRDWVRLGFADDERFLAAYGDEIDEPVVDGWELNRATTTRLAWRPYMYDQALPHLLAGVRVPTLVVQGGGDRIVPPSVAAQYGRLIPGARLVELPGGHRLDIELPGELADLVIAFAAGAASPAADRT